MPTPMEVAAMVTTHLALIAPQLERHERVTALAMALGLSVTDACWPQQPNMEALACAAMVTRETAFAKHRLILQQIQSCEGRA